MTVQQLIDKLSEIEDKSLEVKRRDSDYWDCFPLSTIEIIYDETQLLTQIVVIK